MEQGEQAEGVQLSLSDEAEERFRELRQDDQEQVVYDAWRRVLQDWRHARFEDWKTVDEHTTGKRSVELAGWDDVAIGDHTPSYPDLTLVFDANLGELDDELLAELFADVSEHAETILLTRFNADE